MKINFSLLILSAVSYMQASAQKPISYNLAKLSAAGKIEFRSGQEHAILEGTRPGAISTKGISWFKDITFGTGTIDIDLRGKDVFLNSFLGICFHAADTAKTYDALFFRPFNFKHTDTSRWHWSVAYVSMPDYDYSVLRKNFPRKYENAVSPVPEPNDWFHATIVITPDNLKVFVNHAPEACLEITLLSNRPTGKFGLFSDGLSNDFANLVITPDK